MHVSFFSMLHVLVLQAKPTLPLAIVFVLLQTSTFRSSDLMICLFYFADVAHVIIWAFFLFIRSHLIIHFVLKWLITLLSLNYIVRHIIKFIFIFKQEMLKGQHSSVGSASDLQSRGPGFDPPSGRGVNMN